jgi:hypothetical protein
MVRLYTSHRHCRDRRRFGTHQVALHQQCYLSTYSIRSSTGESVSGNWRTIVRKQKSCKIPYQLSSSSPLSPPRQQHQKRNTLVDCRDHYPRLQRSTRRVICIFFTHTMRGSGSGAENLIIPNTIIIASITPLINDSKTRRHLRRTSSTNANASGITWRVICILLTHTTRGSGVENLWLWA